MATVPSLAKMAGQTPLEISNHREAMPDRAQTLRLLTSYIRIPGKYESGLKKVRSRGAKLACKSRMWQRWRNRERVSQPISKGAMVKSEKAHQKNVDKNSDLRSYLRRFASTHGSKYIHDLHTDGDSRRKSL